MGSLWKSLVGLALVAATSSGLTFLALAPRGGPHGAAAPEEAAESASGVQIEPNERGEVVITLTDAAYERLAIETTPLPAAVRRPQIAAYGRLLEDPAGSFVLRAPLAGVLRRGQQPWPALGESTAAGQQLARLEPRVSPTERIDLLTRLSVAQGEEAEAQASVAAARSSFDQKRKLNEENHIVSDRSLEEAESHFKAENAKLERAHETVQLIQAALAAQSGPSEPTALAAPRAGVVAEVFAQPDEAVEAGQAIARLISLDSLLARVVLSPGDEVDRATGEAQVRIADSGRYVPATSIGVLSSADAGGFPTMLLRVQNTDHALLPGMPLTAWVAGVGAARQGVDVPRAAVVRNAGRAWVYVAQDDNVFMRLPIATDAPTPSGWFVVSADLRADDGVVVVGADGLLSEELKHEIEQEEHASGE